MSTTITETILQTIGDWIAQLVSRVSEWLWNNFQPVFDSIASWLSDVFGRLSDTIGALKTWIQDMAQDIKSYLSSLVDDALGFLQGIYDRVAASISDLFDSVTGYISDVFNSVVEEIIGIADTVNTWIQDAYDSIADGIKSIVDEVVNWLGGLFDDVKLAITSIIERAAAVVDAVVQGIQEFISSVVEVVGSSLRSLLETIANLPDAIAGLGASFTDAVEKFIGKPLSEIPNNLWEAFADNFKLLNGADQERLIGVMNETYLSPNSPPKNNEELRSMFNKLVPETGVMRGIFLTLFGVLGLMLSIVGITQAASQIMVQEWGLTNPYAILQPADAVRAHHFGLIDKETTTIILRKHGHSIADADKLITIGKQAPPEGEALSWWLREIYTDDDIEKALTKKGWNEQDRSALKQAAFFIPPVQDLITMAVREVFTPEIAERFGQFEDFPQDFVTHAKKTGVSEEWARNYWAAHWVLPSPQMGFEMLHRRVITQEDLSLLLKASDVMPFWRDKIIDISYTPFTRVDIRRMHKVEVLDDAEVFEAYQDIGYNEDKASKLTDFTVAINTPEAVDDDVELITLTRASILNFYEDGLLKRDEAYEMLIGLELSEEAANLYLTAIDMDEQRAERKEEINLILAKQKAGLIDFDKAQGDLAELGLEQREYDKALAQLIRQATVKTKLPSKTDLDKMVKAAIIPVATYTETLLLLGYSEIWADRYTQLIGSA